MTDPQLETIYHALCEGDRKTAKKLLLPLVKESPTADAYYYGAFVAKSRAQALALLRRALQLDALHSGANRMLVIVEKQGFDVLQKSKPAPPAGMKRPTETQPLITREAIAKKRKRVRYSRGRRNRLIMFGIGTVLLSLSLSWVTMLMLGVGGFFTDPVAQTFGGDQLITEYNGTPIAQVRNPAQYTALPASVSTRLPLGAENATGDILRGGILHEYKFNGRGGSSIAVAVQFFSPFANDVYPNVAIVDPNGRPAGDRCRREIIIDDKTGAAFICDIDTRGEWLIRIFGREGKSSGAYIVTAESMIDD